jgi:hypothetical protein
MAIRHRADRAEVEQRKDPEHQPPTRSPSPGDPTPAPEARYDAFLCYAREDSDFAVARLRESLIARGKTVWVDVEDIVAGTPWRSRVGRGIAACRAFIVVVSADSPVAWPAG